VLKIAEADSDGVHAHGAELPQTADALAFTIGFVIATGLLHMIGVLARWSWRYRHSRGWLRGRCCRLFFPLRICVGVRDAPRQRRPNKRAIRGVTLASIALTLFGPYGARWR
jgi:hypothetical protein